MYIDQNTPFSSVNLMFNHFIWQLLSCTLHVFPSLETLVFCDRFSPWRNCTHSHLHADLSAILYSDAREILDFHALCFFSPMNFRQLRFMLLFLFLTLLPSG